MPAGDPTDVTSTLTDLERKLVDLERELSTVAGGTAGAVQSTTPIAPATPAETRDATLRVEDLRGEIADLVKFRDQLEAAASQLVSEYDRLVARLQAAEPTEAPAAASTGAPAVVPTPEAAAPETPAETAQTGWTPGPLPPAVAAGMGGPGSRPPAAAAASASDTVSFVGAVVVDAGPFSDITTLQSFEQGLSHVDGAEDVYVKSFEGNRALIDVRLSNPVPLVQLLREQLSLPIIPREAGEGRLVVDLAAPDSHGT